METNAIPDSSLTASSVLDHFTPENGRLHSYEKPGTLNKPGPFGGWRAAPHGRDGSWFQVDFRNWTKVTRISTQGSSSFLEWVTKYTLSYSYDGTFFKDYSKVITCQFHLLEGARAQTTDFMALGIVSELKGNTASDYAKTTATSLDFTK